MRVSQRPASNGSRSRSNVSQARDARVNRDSIGDFADFIRSTGPPGATEPLSPRTAPSAIGHRGMNGSARNASTSVPRVSAVASLPKRSASTAGRNRLQAREAIVPFNDNSSDLIDFIRQGPPSTHDNPRIPRTVAPFRTTMDSDQMSGAVINKIEATPPDPRVSQASTNFSNEHSIQSLHSSVNSHSALLNRNVPPVQTQSHMNFDEEDMMPKRKTRRVKDPYAIDFSDEEEEFEEVPVKPKRNEESLIDFLNNTAPPPQIASAFNEPPPPPPSKQNIKKKSSAPSLMSRFRNATPTEPVPPLPFNYAANGGSKSLPTRNGSTAPQSAHGRSNYASHMDFERNPSRGTQQKTFQPREPMKVRTATSDLADFLMNEPPPPPPQKITPPVEEKTSGFARMFGRRKKSLAA
jgi:hypothetical protein